MSTVIVIIPPLCLSLFVAVVGGMLCKSDKPSTIIFVVVIILSTSLQPRVLYVFNTRYREGFQCWGTGWGGPCPCLGLA